MSEADSKRVYRLVERFDAEQTVYVLASSNAEARAALRGEGDGEFLASTEPSQVGRSRIRRAEPITDVPEWVRLEAGSSWDWEGEEG